MQPPSISSIPLSRVRQYYCECISAKPHAHRMLNYCLSRFERSADGLLSFFSSSSPPPHLLALNSASFVSMANSEPRADFPLSDHIQEPGHHRDKQRPPNTLPCACKYMHLRDVSSQGRRSRRRDISSEREAEIRSILLLLLLRLLLLLLFLFLRVQTEGNVKKDESKPSPLSILPATFSLLLFFLVPHRVVSLSHPIVVIA